MVIPEFWCHHIVKLPACYPKSHGAVEYSLWESIPERDGTSHQRKVGSVTLVPITDPPGEDFEAVLRKLDQVVEVHNGVDLRIRDAREKLIREAFSLEIYDGAEHLEGVIRETEADMSKLEREIAELQPQERSTDGNLPAFMRRHSTEPRVGRRGLVYYEQDRPPRIDGNDWGLVNDAPGLLGGPAI